MDRPPKSSEEIAEISRLPPSELPVWLREHGGGLSAETLAYVYRFGRSSGYPEVSKRAAELIVGSPNLDGSVTGGRCEAIIRKQALAFGLLQDRDLLMDYRGDCYRKLIEDLNAGGEAKPFLEERFGLYLKKRAIDVGESFVKRRETRAWTEEEFGRLSMPPQSDESIVLDDLTDSEFRRILKKLPHKLAMAFWLEWNGLPVQTKDKKKPSISGVMEVSPTMIHKYLGKARALLQQDPDVLKLLGKDVGAE